MKIVIDLQGAQTDSMHRGIGRYSVAFTQALLRNAQHHDIFLALNSSLPYGLEHALNIFNELLPQDHIHIWQTPSPAAALHIQNYPRQKIAEPIRESFLTSLQPDILHITSLFEGFTDDAVTSIGVQEPNLLTSTTLYDLIPLIHQDIYSKQHPNLLAWYQQKLAYLKRSNLCLAISESSRMEAIEHLDISPESVVNVSAAADAIFKILDISPEAEQVFKQRYGITKPFIMYTGGFDHRKNFEGLMRAFALLPESIHQQYQLVIVCAMQENQRKLMKKYITSVNLNADDIIFTGYVSDQDLVTFYNLCHLFIFPSWHEGFGLPILEAMHCGAPVIGSNCSSIPEVIGRKDALFDPRSDKNIAEKIYQSLSDLTFYQSLKGHSLLQAKKFSWDATAKSAIAAFEALHERNSNKEIKSIYVQNNSRLKLAYISPFPPAKTGIADYSAALLPALSSYYEIDVIVDQKIIDETLVKEYAEIHDFSWFTQHYQKYDRIIYQMGNSDFHTHMFGGIANYPGVVVLHDFFLSGIIARIDVDAESIEMETWSHALYHSHGYGALQSRFHKRDIQEVIYTYPCSLNVLENATGIITHSVASQKLAEHWYDKKITQQWQTLPLPRTLVTSMKDKKNLKATLGYSEDDFIVCSFGFLAQTKLNHLLLEAWALSTLSQQKNCHLVFVGEVTNIHYEHHLKKIIQKIPFKNNIHITGFNTYETYQAYLSIADSAIQLRSHARGETSAAVLDCMNYGIPTIVNASGSMAELPEDCLILLPDKFENEALKIALENLWQDKEQRDLLSQRSKDYIAQYHSPLKIAQQYYEMIEAFYHGPATTKTRLLKKLATDKNLPDKKEDQLALCDIIAFNQYPHTYGKKQIFIDVSSLHQEDLKNLENPIQRVIHGLLKIYLLSPPDGYRVEPVHLTGSHEYFYARKFSLAFLDCPTDILEDSPIEPKPGDIFLGLDPNTTHLTTDHAHFFDQLRHCGVKVFFDEVAFNSFLTGKRIC